MSSSVLTVGLGLFSVYPSSNAGTTTYVHGLLSGLADDNEVEVIAVVNSAMGHTCREFARRGATVRGSRRYDAVERRFGRVPALGMTTLFPAVTPGALQHVDVVHYPQTVRSPRVDRPAVVTLHDVQHLDLPHLFPTSIRIWRRFLYDRSARQADAVITVSEHARARIIDHLDVDPDRVHVSYHGVDSALFTPLESSNDAETRYRMGVEEPYLYYPASLAPHKNHRALLAALRLLDGHRLILTGPHSNRLGELHDQGRQYGVSDRVQHLGLVASEDLPALYRGASCLVFPSLYEGFGVPIVEAMASACPVACSDRGATLEIAGGAAVLFDPDEPEAIANAVETLDDSAVRDRCVADGIRRAAEFTWSKAAERHRHVYELAAR